MRDDHLDADESRSRSGLARALAVIGVIAERSPRTLGVSTIARELALPKAVTYRMLKELTVSGFLSFDERTKQYRLGPGALAVGLAALRALDVPAIAQPYLVGLVETTGETATLSVRQGSWRVYVDQVLSPHEVRMSVSLGTRHPLHAGSSSKAILAALPDAEIDDYLAHHELAAVTDSTITSVTVLREEIGRIRGRGYAVSLGERQPGAGSAAAAIRAATGQIFGSVSVCGPQDRFKPAIREAHGELVARTAAQISAQIGFRSTPGADTARVVG